MFSLLLFDIVVLLLAVAFAKWRGATWTRASLQAILLAPILALMVLGLIYNAERRMPDELPTWVGGALEVLFWSTVPLGLVVIALVRNGRTPATVFAFFQVLLGFVCAFGVGMRVTGAYP